MVSTPLDLQNNKEFRKSFRGYREQDVDNFMARVLRDYEQIYRQNQELQEQLEDLKEKLGQYELIEDTLQKTLVLAQETAEEVRRSAEKEAGLIVEKARLHGENILRAADDRVEEIREEYERLRQLDVAYRTQLKSFFQAQLILLDQGPEVEEVSKVVEEEAKMEAEVAVSVDPEERVSLGL